MDILLTETGSGGDVVVCNHDLVTIAGYENTPYLAQYGGSSCWADDLLFFGDTRHTARTEKVVNTTPLTSTGRVLIEEAMNDDLLFIQDDVAGTKTNASVRITDTNEIAADITINGLSFYMNFKPDSLYLTYKLR